MTHLDLPGCFESGWKLPTRVGAWGVLEVLARALLGPAHAHLVEDPIWSVLAELDGREPRTLPSRGFRGHDAFLLPATWFDQVGPEAIPSYFWAARAGRLRVWSGAGYLIADTPRDKATAVEAQGILEAFSAEPGSINLKRRPFDTAPVEPLAGPFAKGITGGLTRWTAFVIPYLRYRLSTSLGLNPADQTGLTETLLVHPGTLYVTSSHVDLAMSLKTIVLPVRRAGLDRDPGWLPSFGRVIKFHFE